jgi:hypothetical protein
MLTGGQNPSSATSAESILKERPNGSVINALSCAIRLILNSCYVPRGNRDSKLKNRPYRPIAQKAVCNRTLACRDRKNKREQAASWSLQGQTRAPRTGNFKCSIDLLDLHIPVLYVFSFFIYTISIVL